jgi:adenylylsulfate kinase-like enzyme
MERDRKGTYRKGRAGESATVPGLQDPYEPPLDPALRIDTTRIAPEAAAEMVMAALRARRLIQ